MAQPSHCNPNLVSHPAFPALETPSHPWGPLFPIEEVSIQRKYVNLLIYTLYIKNVIGCQFSSVTQLCPTLRDLMDCSTPDFFVHHQLPEFAQTHVHWVGDAIQPSHPLSVPSPTALNEGLFSSCLSQHQGLFQGVSSSHWVTKVLELQHKHQSFQWIFRTDFL